MARAISMRHTVVPSAERDAHRARAREILAHYTRAGCRYWLFEDEALPGSLVEFYEASDKATLVKAHETRPGPVQQANRVYLEVELA